VVDLRSGQQAQTISAREHIMRSNETPNPRDAIEVPQYRPDDQDLDAPDPRDTIYSDPPGMPDDERMTPAEFRVFREWLGLTLDWLAEMLGVQGRTVRRWEAGTAPIPDGVRLQIEEHEAKTARFIGLEVARLRDAADIAMTTYRTDADYRAAVGGAPTLPASWHRAVCARIAQEIPGLSITYWNEG
jgi:DNA-binding XRE family transcriptional regulator